MSSYVFHVDQNVVLVILEKQREDAKQQIRKINKEKLKIMLQISGCKPSHSYKLCERIFEMIFSKLAENMEKQPQAQLKQQTQKPLNSATITEKYFKELVFSSVLEKKYIKEKGESYKEDFSIAWSLTERKSPLIILLGGTSGTGKSTASSILASRFGISTVLSTDSIRHIMRNFINKEENPILFASSYEAGRYLAEEGLSESRRIIKGYKQQCEMVQQRLEHVISAFEQKSDSIIIEGVHLTPFFMFKTMKRFKRVLAFAMCIKKESKHKERFAVRSKYMTLDSRSNKYVENFPNIRLIQKWFLEKADEFLIPKVDNVNIDKSIDTIHRTIIQYMKKVINNPDQDWTEMKNAFPFYEEYSRINKVVWSSKEVKDYIHSKVNKTEIYESFLQSMNTKQDKVLLSHIKELEADQNQADNEQKSQTKVWLQQSVHKFDQINIKNGEKNVNPENSTEVNYIVDQNENKGDINHLSDQEDQNEERRRRNQESEQTKIIKKTKSLKTIASLVQEEKAAEDEKLAEVVQLPVEQTEHHKQKQTHLKVAFQEEFTSTEEPEQTPQKTDYKGLLHHLSKHKRLFLSKKTKPSNLGFIKKMVENYNQNYLSHDRIKLLQNNDGSYCLFKINVHRNLRKGDSREESSSEQDERYHQSRNVARRGTSRGNPRQIFLSLSVGTNQTVTACGLEMNKIATRMKSWRTNKQTPLMVKNRLKGGSSSDEEQACELNQMKKRMIEEDEDSIELQMINEEDEFNQDEVEEVPVKLQVDDEQFIEQSPL